MTRIYLDSSALLKRAFDETESEALMVALQDVAAAGGHLITSALARVEVSRAVRTRLDVVAPLEGGRAATEAFSGVAIAHLSDAVLESARIIGPVVLRTLDALHLATAVAVAADEVWTYDGRMATASEELGIPVRAPGHRAAANPQ